MNISPSPSLNVIGDSYSGGYRLREVRNNLAYVQTLNAHNQSNYANATDFTNTITNWTQGNWTNFSQDQAALDAHWGLEKVLDFWYNVFNRVSIDGNRSLVINYVHYYDSNPLYGWPNNAAWDGNNEAMRYGDGDGITFNPFTALDICGHETGHGICQYTANLTPGTQESGALNEGFSDIWGASIEYWAAPNKQTWLMGEEIFRPYTYNCIRNLQNPEDSFASEGLHPNTYQGPHWDPNGEPHNNSTVLSHWYYLLSQGDTGTNGIGNNYNVSGIGITNAEQIAWRTESQYLTSSANYSTARTASIQAATDLFGANS